MDTKEFTKKGEAFRKPLNERPHDEFIELSRKGGLKSAEKRAERKAARDIMQDIFYSRYDGKEDIKKKIESKGLSNNELTGLLLQMASKAGHNANMARLVLEVSGDLQPAGQNVQVNVINQMSDDQIQAELDKLGGGNGCINITPEPPQIE